MADQDFDREFLHQCAIGGSGLEPLREAASRLQKENPFDLPNEPLPLNWEEQKSALTMEELVEFQVLIRALNARAREIPNPAVAKLFEKLNEVVDRRVREADMASEKSLECGLHCTLAYLPPTYSNLQLLNTAYDRIEEETKKPSKAESTGDTVWVPASHLFRAEGRGTPVVVHRGATPGQEEAFELRLKRCKNLERLMQEAVELGLVKKRGPHVYLRSRHLGNGEHTAAWKLTADPDEEFRFRLALRRARQKNGGGKK